MLAGLLGAGGTEQEQKKQHEGDEHGAARHPAHQARAAPAPRVASRRMCGRCFGFAFRSTDRSFELLDGVRCARVACAHEPFLPHHRLQDGHHSCGADPPAHLPTEARESGRTPRVTMCTPPAPPWAAKRLPGRRRSKKTHGEGQTIGEQHQGAMAWLNMVWVSHGSLTTPQGGTGWCRTVQGVVQQRGQRGGVFPPVPWSFSAQSDARRTACRGPRQQRPTPQVRPATNSSRTHPQAAPRPEHKQHPTRRRAGNRLAGSPNKRTAAGNAWRPFEPQP